MGPSAGRRRFVGASIVGAVGAFIGFALVLAAGRTDFLVREQVGNFYDAQARSLLHGHWSVPASQLAFEGFLINGKTYTYFGPWPSVLRMPFLELAPSTYGRLTQLSMLLAFAIFTAGVIALHWRIRDLLRPDAPLGRSETLLAVAVPIVLGCGSSVLFLASRSWVYHEAILWGIAWSVVAYERIIAFLRSPTVGRLVGASAAATLAFSSRASVGLGTVVALALVLVGQLVRWVRDTLEHRHRPSDRGPMRALTRLDWMGVRTSEPAGGRRWIVGTAGAVAIPIVAYSYTNWSRFGSLFTVPWHRQLLYRLDPTTRGPLAASGGGYFSLKYLPTTLLQYFRPDALRLNALFPWVTFPRSTPTIIGNVVISHGASSSLPASMPALAFLASVGILAAGSYRFAGSHDASVLRVPIIGAAAGVVVVLAAAVLAQRYLGDWIPLLAMAGLAGIHTLIRRREAREPGRSRAFSTALLALISVLAAASLWFNGSLALLYQRLYNPWPDTLRAGMLGFEYDIGRMTGSGAAQLKQVDALPLQPAPAGTTAIVGKCAALYWSDGTTWFFVEGSPTGGVVALRAAFPGPTDTAWQPLITWAGPNGPDVIALRRRGGSIKVSRGFHQPDGSLTFSELYPGFRSGLRRFHTIEIVVSRPLQLLRVRIDGEDALLLAQIHDLPSGPYQVGTANGTGVAASYPASIRELPPQTKVCAQIRRSAR